MKKITYLYFLVALPIVSQGAEREFSTDRPDTTESPFTVDAGYYQVELEPVSWMKDKTNGVDTRLFSTSGNFKYGITDHADLQLVVEAYNHLSVTENNQTINTSGVGDTEIRYKQNFWGDDGGDTAFGILPFIRLPTHSKAFSDQKHTEEGLIFPLSISLPEDWDMATMIEWEHIRNDADTTYVNQWTYSASFGHHIAGEWSGFMELAFSKRNEPNNQTESYFNAGLTRAIGTRAQFDVGFNKGISSIANDWRIFIGFSFKSPW